MWQIDKYVFVNKSLRCSDNECLCNAKVNVYSNKTEAALVL